MWQTGKFQNNQHVYRNLIQRQRLGVTDLVSGNNLASKTLLKNFFSCLYYHFGASQKTQETTASHH